MKAWAVGLATLALLAATAGSAGAWGPAPLPAAPAVGCALPGLLCAGLGSALVAGCVAPLAVVGGLAYHSYAYDLVWENVQALWTGCRALGAGLLSGP